MKPVLSLKHQAVLLHEAVSHLVVNPSGIYVDATFGRGGHSKEILQHIDFKGKLFCIDKDPEAIQVAKELKDEGLYQEQAEIKPGSDLT